MKRGDQTPPMVEVKNLKMFFPARRGLLGSKPQYVKAVNDISFSVARGETFGLVGESGCGKTTTGRCILRINEPTEGEILLEGQDIAHLSNKELKPYRHRMQMIFQDPYGSLDPRQSVFSIVKEAVAQNSAKMAAPELRDRVNQLLELVELNPDLGDRYPHEMSGGQRQRLGIARALACGPDLIVCDEPVSALDVSIQAQIINLFRRLQQQLNLTYLFIAHDLAVVRHISDRIAVMYLGKIMEVTDAAELYLRPIHPYTQALLSAVPVTDYREEHKRQRIMLQGEVPSPMNLPAGCPFHPRCPRATDLCRGECPPLVQIGPGHWAACYHAQP